MTFRKRGFRALALGLLVTAGLALTPAAFAGGHLSVGVSLPGVAIGVGPHHTYVGVGGYGYAPGYYAPAYYPAGPVYYDYGPAYYGPAYYGGVVYTGGGYYRGGYRGGYYHGGHHGGYDRGGYHHR